MKWYLKIGFFICLTGMLLAQSLTRLEQILNEQTLRLQQQQAISDSLEKALQKQTYLLEKEKKRTKPNKEKIKSLMAEIVELSRQLDHSRQQETTLQAALEKTRQSLEAQYEHKIDSLQSVLQSGHFVGERTELEQELLHYQEKRLAISPPLPGLHFDPRKITEINPDAARDSTEQLIYTDYLQNALEEVQQHLERLKKLRRDYLKIWQLRLRTHNFVEDVTSEGHITVLSVPPSRNASIQNDGNTNFTNLKPGITDFPGSIPSLNQTLSILSIYNQLEPQNRWHDLLVNNEQPMLSPEEYLNLLDRTIRKLQHYREVIARKLERTEKTP